MYCFRRHLSLAVLVVLSTTTTFVDAGSSSVAGTVNIAANGEVSAAAAETCLLDGGGCLSADVEAEEEARAMEEATEDSSITSPATLIRDDDMNLGQDFGVPQRIVENGGTITKEAVLAKIREAEAYMVNEVAVDDAKFGQIRHACVNKHEECAAWAVRGECENNPSYMHVNCAPVCMSCDLLDINKRCPMPENAVDALTQPGDLNRIFERITTDPYYQQYEPIVLSRPSYAPGDNAKNATYQIGMWLVQFEKALTPEEADRMAELGKIEGYKRSQGVGKIQADGTWEETVSETRTSSNSVREINA